VAIGSGGTTKKKKFITYLLLIGSIVLLLIIFSLFGHSTEEKPKQVEGDVTIPLKLLVDSFNRYNGLANTIESQISEKLHETSEVKTGSVTIKEPLIPKKWGDTPVKIVEASGEKSNDNITVDYFMKRNTDKVKEQMFIYYSYWNTDISSSFGYSLWYILSPSELHILTEILSSKADGVWGYNNSLPLIKAEMNPAVGVIYRRSLFFPVVQIKDSKGKIVNKTIVADENIPQGSKIIGFSHKVEQGVYIYDVNSKQWYAFPYREVQRRIYATSLLPKDILNQLIKQYEGGR